MLEILENLNRENFSQFINQMERGSKYFHLSKIETIDDGTIRAVIDNNKTKSKIILEFPAQSPKK